MPNILIQRNICFKEDDLNAFSFYQGAIFHGMVLYRRMNTFADVSKYQ
jgi:hypothetical protein